MLGVLTIYVHVHIYYCDFFLNMIKALYDVFTVITNIKIFVIFAFVDDFDDLGLGEGYLIK